MYESFYRLSTNPFRLVPDARLFFASDSHKRGLAYLRYGLHQGQGFVVVTGKPGTGKSTLVQALFSHLTDAALVVASITSTNLGAEDILQAVGHSFDVYGEGRGKASLLIAIENFLKARARMGKRVLLIVDEAQNLPLKSLEELRMLSNFQLGDQPLLQIMLLGQQELRAMLAQPELEQLAQRVIASCHLKPLSPDETRTYIAHRLHCVGWRDDPTISGEALALVYGASQGIPRLINIFCDRLFLAASLDERHEIDQALAQRVYCELKEESTGSFALGQGIQSAVLPDLAPLPAPDLLPQAANDAIAAVESEVCSDALARTAGERTPVPVEGGDGDSHAFEPSFRRAVPPSQSEAAPTIPPALGKGTEPSHPGAIHAQPAASGPPEPEPLAARVPPPAPQPDFTLAPSGPGHSVAQSARPGGKKWSLLLLLLFLSLMVVLTNLYLFRDKLALPPQLSDWINRLQMQVAPATPRPVSDARPEHKERPAPWAVGQVPDQPDLSVAAPARSDAGRMQMAPVFGGSPSVSSPTPESVSVPAQDAPIAAPQPADAVQPALMMEDPIKSEPAPAIAPQPAVEAASPAARLKAPITPRPAGQAAPVTESEPPVQAVVAPTEAAAKRPAVTQTGPAPAAPASARPPVPPATPAADDRRQAQVRPPESVDPEFKAEERPGRAESGTASVSSSGQETAMVDLPPAVNATQVPDGGPTDFELIELLYNLVLSYESGDLAGLVNLFAKNAEADGAKGLARIRKDYLALFNATEMRSMKVEEVKWRKQDKGARGEAQFVVTVWRNGGEATSQRGELNLDVVRRGEDVLIQRLAHQVE